MAHFLLTFYLEEVTKVVDVCGQRVFLKLQLDQVELQDPQLEVLVVELNILRHWDAAEPLLHSCH